MRLTWLTLNRLQWAMTAAALAILATAVILVAPFAGRYDSGTLLIVGSFLAAMVLGELWRVTLLDTREIAPLAIAASLAFAMTAELPAQEFFGHDAAFVVIVASLGVLGGSALHRLVTGDPVRTHSLAMRVMTVTVAAVLVRAVPWSQGQTVVELQEGWAGERWRTAIAFLLCAAAAMQTRVLLQGIRRAVADHAPLLRSLIDEAQALAPLTVALATTSTIIALAARSLGPVAIPLFLSPLVLLQLALRRQSTIRTTNRQTIRALSRLTEQGGYTAAGHSAQVAQLAVAIGRHMGMSERELLDLEYAALLHDIGQVTLSRPIPGGATVEAAPGDQRMISSNGAAILARTGELARLSEILAEQSTPYREVRELGGELPLASRIIKVANAYEDLTADRRTARSSELAVERIQLGLGYEYDPYVVEALVRVLDRRVTPSA